MRREVSGNHLNEAMSGRRNVELLLHNKQPVQFGKSHEDQMSILSIEVNFEKT